VSSSKGDVATSFNVRAPRHFTVNATTAFLSSLKDIRETVEQSTDEKSELVRAGYSGLSAYTGYVTSYCYSSERYIVTLVFNSALHCVSYSGQQVACMPA
jgi:hypothetical protein